MFGSAPGSASEQQFFSREVLTRSEVYAHWMTRIIAKLPPVLPTAFVQSEPPARRNVRDRKLPVRAAFSPAAKIPLTWEP